MAKKKQSTLKKPITFSLGSVLLFVVVFAVVGAYVIYSSYAARAPLGTCAYSSASNGGVVSASGLPNDTVINFFMKDNSTGGQTGWVLGITHDGTWQVNVPTATHSTTYDFTGKTYSKNGAKYNIYAECTQAV
jgi:uncharacterized protein (UPF0333 family)